MVPPIDGFPREGHVLGSVHHRVSNLSFGSGDLGDRITSQAHLSTSAPLSRPGTGPGIQPVIQQRRPGGAIQGCAGFLSAFARRHSLLGHPVPAREFRSPHGRPTRQRLDPGGVSTFRTSETRPDWVPSLPRGPAVLTRPVRSLRPPLAPSSRGQALSPRRASHLPELSITRRHQGFTRVHPPGLPPRL